MKKAIRKTVALIGIGLSLLALLIVLFILVKGWGLRTPLKEGVSIIAGVAEQALQRLEGGAARLRAPVGKALVALDQVEAAAREWRRRGETEGPLSGQILVTLHDRFSQEMKNRLQEFRDMVEGLKAGVVQAEAEAFSKRIQWFRAPLTRIQKALENTENQLAARRQALIELEGNLLFKIDLGILALSLLCPILMAGQASMIYLFWGLFQKKSDRFPEISLICFTFLRDHRYTYAKRPLLCLS